MEIFIFNAEHEFILVIANDKQDAINLINEANIFEKPYKDSNYTCIRRDMVIDLKYSYDDTELFNHCTNLKIERGITIFGHSNE